jgi:hypothetical protein
MYQLLIPSLSLITLKQNISLASTNNWKNTMVFTSPISLQQDEINAHKINDAIIEALMEEGTASQLRPHQLFAMFPPLESTQILPLVPPGTQATVHNNVPPLGNQKKRNRFSYASKKFNASSSIFLVDGKEVPEGFKATGRIVGCPNAKTGHMFRVQWDLNSLSDGLDPSWLKTELPPTKEVKECLQRAITMYYATNGNTLVDDSTRSEQVINGSTAVGENQVSNSNRQPQPGTPLSTVRVQYLADLRTAASGLSSITNSTNWQYWIAC